MASPDQAGHGGLPAAASVKSSSVTSGPHSRFSRSLMKASIAAESIAMPVLSSIRVNSPNRPKTRSGSYKTTSPREPPWCRSHVSIAFQCNMHPGLQDNVSATVVDLNSGLQWVVQHCEGGPFRMQTCLSMGPLDIIAHPTLLKFLQKTSE